MMSTANNNKATTKDINVQLLKDYIEKEQTKRNERLAKKIKNERRVKFPSNNNNNSDDLITMLVNNHLAKQKIEQAQEKTDEFLQHRLEYIQKVRKHVLPNTKYEFVNNSVRFFERNLQYFVAHPFEFQRLVGQLRTKQERQLFLHTVYMYYYPDVLQELNRLKEQKQSGDDGGKLNKKKDAPTVVNSLIRQFRLETGAKSGNNEKLPMQQNINTQKITAAYNTIQKNTELLAEDSYEQFYNLLVQLNSSEAICLETMMLP